MVILVAIKIDIIAYAWTGRSVYLLADGANVTELLIVRKTGTILMRIYAATVQLSVEFSCGVVLGYNIRFLWYCYTESEMTFHLPVGVEGVVTIWAFDGFCLLPWRSVRHGDDDNEDITFV